MRDNHCDVLLRGHHLHLLFIFYCLKREDKIRENMLGDGYGKKHINFTISLLKKISRSDVRVKIVDFADDICDKCVYRKKCIGRHDNDMVTDDRTMAWNVGLNIDEIYGSQQVLKNLFHWALK